MSPCSSAKVVLSKVYQGMTDKGEWNVCLVELFFFFFASSMLNPYVPERESELCFCCAVVNDVKCSVVGNVLKQELLFSSFLCIPVIFHKINVYSVTA